MMHDEHTSVAGVPKYAGTGADPPPIIIDDEVAFRSTCAPLPSAGKPVRLSTPPAKKPQRSPVAEENKAPEFIEGPPMLNNFQSTVTPAFSSPVTDWEEASAALIPLASDAGVMPVYCDTV